MREQVGNLWAVAAPGEVLVITTNGKVRRDGTAVMGRGVAQQAAVRDPAAERELGRLISVVGNHVHRFRRGDVDWLSYPVKHNWWEEADPDLIVRSAHELVATVDDLGYTAVWLPRPGCGNGRLLWEDVKPLIESILDDRFVVVNR